MPAPDSTSRVSTRTTQSSTLSARQSIPGPLIWLSLLLVGQLLLIAFVYWPSGPAATTGGPLLPNFNAADIRQIQIEAADDQSVTLARAENGWTVLGTDGYPANATKADKLLNDLAATTTNRLVTQTAASHNRLQVAADNFNRRITLTGADGATQVVYLGISAGGAATHVRAGDADTVYLSGQLAPWEIEPFLSGWVNTTYVSLNTADVRGIRVQNPAGELDLVRAADGTWARAAPDEQSDAVGLDSNAVNDLLNQLVFLSFQNILGQSPPAETDAQSPLVRVDLDIVATDPDADSDADSSTGEDVGEDIGDSSQPAMTTLTLEFGAMAADDGETYFVKSSESDYYVTVLPQTVTALAEITQDDLLASEPDSPAADAPELPDTGLPDAELPAAGEPGED